MNRFKLSDNTPKGKAIKPSAYPKCEALSDEAVQELVEKGVRYVNYDTGEGMDSLSKPMDKPVFNETIRKTKAKSKPRAKVKAPKQKAKRRNKAKAIKQKANVKAKKPAKQTYISWLRDKLSDGNEYHITELMNGHSKQLFHDCKSRLFKEGMSIKCTRKGYADTTYKYIGGK